jgi:hypothetical protein
LLRQCWKCDYWQETDIDIYCCEICGADIDFSPYISPYNNVPLPSEKEATMIIDSGLTPYFKKGDVEVGTKGKIKTAFEPSGKFQNPTGEVDLNGTIYKISLNKTSLYDIVRAFGNDTKKWVGREIVYSREDVETKQGAVYRDISIFRGVK